MEDFISTTAVFDQFIPFIPVLTLSNVIRAFPEYNFNQLPCIKAVYLIEDTINYEEMGDINLTHRTPNVKDIEIENIDSKSMHKVVDENTMNFDWQHQIRRIRDTTIWNMTQFIKHFGSTRFQLNWRMGGSAGKFANDFIASTDQIGLNDLLSIKAKVANLKANGGDHDKDDSYLVAAYFCLIFLRVILPLDSSKIQNGITVYDSYFYATFGCGASRSDDTVDEVVAFFFQNSRKSMRKVEIVIEDR